MNKSYDFLILSDIRLLNFYVLTWKKIADFVHIVHFSVGVYEEIPSNQLENNLINLKLNIAALPSIYLLTSTG